MIGGGPYLDIYVCVKLIFAVLSHIIHSYLNDYWPTPAEP